MKSILSSTLAVLFRATARVRRLSARLGAHARLAAELSRPLPASTVILGRCHVFGTGAVDIGENCLLYPDLHLETQGEAVLRIGTGVVISRGTHIVAMREVTIGEGTMIGEFVSIRDTNHTREPGKTIRQSGYAGAPIVLGKQVWIGRGAAILAGVTIGDGATIGANAVVTRNVASRTTVAGVPARPLSPSDR